MGALGSGIWIVYLPGFVKADGSVPFPGTTPAILGLEGALKSPAAVSTIFPQEGDQFQTELQEVVNLPFKIIGTDEERRSHCNCSPLWRQTCKEKSSKRYTAGCNKEYLVA